MAIDQKKASKTGMEDLGEFCESLGGTAGFAIVLDEEEQGLLLVWGKTRATKRRMERYLVKMGMQAKETA